MIQKLFVVMLILFVVSANAQAAKNLLIVVTGASKLNLKNGEVYDTGYWLEEFSTPYQIFEKAGFQITVATPQGNRPTADHGSIAVENGKPRSWPTLEDLNNGLSVKKRVLDEGSIMMLNMITGAELSKFDAVFFPGGHGPMADLINNSDVARILRHFHKKNKPTALVCHAPAVLTSTAGKDFPYKGYKVTAFTDVEESQTPVGPKMITTPQKVLTKAGAIFQEGPAWQAHVVEDRELITGQNPASSKTLAEALLKKLSK